MTQELSKDQMDDLKAAFRMFDTDGNGTIDAQELGAVMRALGLNPTEAELKNLIDEIDTEGEGSIGFNNFITLMVGQLTENELDEEIRQAFLIFDKDGDGFVSSGELKEVLASIGGFHSDEDILDIIHEHDDDGDGMLNYEEFEVMMKGKESQVQNAPSTYSISNF